MVSAKTRLKESVERNRKVREAMLKLKANLEKAEQKSELDRQRAPESTKTPDLG